MEDSEEEALNAYSGGLISKNAYYYDLRETFRFNILKYIGRPKPPKHDIPFVNPGIHKK